MKFHLVLTKNDADIIAFTNMMMFLLPTVRQPCGIQTQLNLLT